MLGKEKATTMELRYHILGGVDWYSAGAAIAYL